MFNISLIIIKGDIATFPILITPKSQKRLCQSTYFKGLFNDLKDTEEDYLEIEFEHPYLLYQIIMNVINDKKFPYHPASMEIIKWQDYFDFKADLPIICHSNYSFDELLELVDIFGYDENLIYAIIKILPDKIDKSVMTKYPQLKDEIVKHTTEIIITVCGTNDITIYNYTRRKIIKKILLESIREKYKIEPFLSNYIITPDSSKLITKENQKIYIYDLDHEQPYDIFDPQVNQSVVYGALDNKTIICSLPDSYILYDIYSHNVKRIPSTKNCSFQSEFMVHNPKDLYNIYSRDKFVDGDWIYEYYLTKIDIETGSLLINQENPICVGNIYSITIHPPFVCIKSHQNYNKIFYHILCEDNNIITELFSFSLKSRVENIGHIDITFSLDTKYMVIANRDIFIYDLRTFKIIKKYSNIPGPFVCIKYLTENLLLFSTFPDSFEFIVINLGIDEIDKIDLNNIRHFDKIYICHRENPEILAILSH